MKIGLILTLLTAFVMASASNILARNTTTALVRLEQLAASRARLESAISTADHLAYQQSAQGTPDTPLNAMVGEPRLNSPRWLSWAGGVLMSFIAILVTAALIAVIRRPILPESVPTNGSEQKYLVTAGSQ